MVIHAGSPLIRGQCFVPNFLSGRLPFARKSVVLWELTNGTDSRRSNLLIERKKYSFSL